MERTKDSSIAPTGSTDWRDRPTEIHFVSIELSEDVSDTLALADLALYNLSTEESISLQDVLFDYDEQAETGTWDFRALTALDPGWYRITLSAAGITDVAGNELDGDGDGTGGDDWVYGGEAPQDDMLLPILGDCDLDGDNDFFDYVTLKVHFGLEGNWRDGDLDYDGHVTFYDYITQKEHFGQSVTR